MGKVRAFLTVPAYDSLRYQAWRRLRCPERYQVDRQDPGRNWPVRFHLRCVRFRAHPGLCRSWLPMPVETTSGPTRPATSVQWTRLGRAATRSPSR